MFVELVQGTQASGRYLAMRCFVCGYSTSHWPLGVSAEQDRYAAWGVIESMLRHESDCQTQRRAALRGQP